MRRYSVRLSRIIALLFNTLTTKHNFIAEKLETSFIVPFFSPPHEITYIAGYLLVLLSGSEFHNLAVQYAKECMSIFGAG